MMTVQRRQSHRSNEFKRNIDIHLKFHKKTQTERKQKDGKRKKKGGKCNLMDVVYAIDVLLEKFLFECICRLLCIVLAVVGLLDVLKRSQEIIID